MSLYKHAIDRIVQAYDTTRPLPTRLEVAAALRVFFDRLDTREFFPDLPEPKRKDLQNALIMQFHCLALEATHARTAFFYLHGLAHIFRRTLSLGPVTMEDASRQLTARVGTMKHHPAYIEFMTEANRMADENPHLYALDSLADLQARARHYKTDVPRAKIIFNHISGHMRAERMFADLYLEGLAEELDPRKFDARLAALYMPSTGPHSAEELCLCLLAAHNAVVWQNTRIESERLALREAIMRLATSVRALSLDLPDSHMESFTDIGPIEYFKLLRRAPSLFRIPTVVAIGMTRFYIEHHRDKIPAENLTDIITKLQRIYTLSSDVNFREMTQNGYHIEDQVRQALVHKMLAETWQSLPHPALAETQENLLERFDTKKRKRFLNILEETSEFLEPVVTYYSEQHEDIRKLRRSLFKSSGPREGQEAYKSAFIRMLAQDDAEKLLAAGLSPYALDHMREAGKIPEADSQRLGQLTVDHIIDLHCGGTNDTDNFALMPARLNKMKNDILLLQTGIHDEESRKRGFWAITLRPRMDAVGQPVRIVIPLGNSYVSCHSGPWQKLTPDGI